MVARNDDAWALPRPSASASAKLPNSTVSHSQNTSWPWNAALPGAPIRVRTHSTVASAATSPVTNITGLRTRVRGLSLNTASRAAAVTSGPVNRDADCAIVCIRT